jgi:hypothetical protein
MAADGGLHREHDNGGVGVGGGIAQRRRREKLALNTKVLWLGRLALKSKVTPRRLGQDQFLLALFIDSLALYSRLIQSLV